MDILSEFMTKFLFVTSISFLIILLYIFIKHKRNDRIINAMIKEINKEGKIK